MLILANESIDESLEMLAVAGPEAAQVASHDELYQEVTEKIEAAEEDVGEDTADATTDDVSGDEGLPEDQTAHSSPISAELNTDEVLATEGELFDKFSETASSLASSAFSGVKSLASYGGNAVMYLAGLATALGIKYGPGVLEKLGSVTLKTLSGSLYSLYRLRTGLKRGVSNFTHSQTMLKRKLESLSATLAKLEAQDTIPFDRAVDTFQSPRFWEACLIGNKVSPVLAINAINDFLSTTVSAVDRGMEADVRTIELLIENTLRGIRFSTEPYLATHFVAAGYSPRSISGYEVNTDLLVPLAYKSALPSYCVPMAALPTAAVIKEASVSHDLSDVARAYHSSFMVLGISYVRATTPPILHYMDKKELRVLLTALATTVKHLAEHKSLYESVNKRADRLKLSYEHYIHWYSTTNEQKSLRQTLLDVIKLKQHFVTRVYLPAMLDTYAYASNHVLTMLNYAERSIKQIKLTSAT